MTRSPLRRFATFGQLCLLALMLAMAASVGSSRAMPAPARLAGAQPSGAGGGAGPTPRDGLAPEQYQAIEAQLARSQALLARQGKLPIASAAPSITFAWPLRMAQGPADYGYHGISNFVDHNSAFPGQVLDYNSGGRTYDLASGYNHTGTDFYLWPFSWQKMDAGAIEVVAAADGVILDKTDGFFDRSCSINSNDWNAVYLQHSDGTVTWYGHLKNGSVTQKLPGDAVVAGEYLGLVGSSGSSTAPHLHFEVHGSGGNAIDPYVGPANPGISKTLWKTQAPYYDSAINHLGTGTAPPVFPACPNPETSNEQVAFAPNSTIYFVTYYRDQLAGQISEYRIYRPDHTVYREWTHSSPAAYYSSSYWYWYFSFAPSEQRGAWLFEVSYQGHTYQRTFYLGPELTRRVALPWVAR